MIPGLRIDEQHKALYYEKGYWTTHTLNDIWIERVRNHGDKEYVADDQGSRLTYREVDDRAARLASWLAGHGVAVGDVVSFQIPTWAEFSIVYVACLKVGAVMHPLSWKFNDEDLVYNMNKVGTKAFICPTYFHKCDYEKMALDIADRIPSLGSVALIDKVEPSLHGLPTLSSVARASQPLTAKPAVSADDVACILTTSGTTGKSKEVMLTHNNLVFSERSFVKGFKRGERDVMFMPSPLNHATGFFHGILSPMILGGRTVLMQDFNAKGAIALMNAEGATWSMGATPFIYDILTHIEKEQGEPLETLGLFLCGGAPVPSSLVRRAWRQGILLCEIYGSTESCPHVYVPPEHCLEWDGAWSGIPFEGIEVRAVDERRREVERGGHGEECSRGPHQFVGYYADPERTDRILDGEGWFYSGDLCRIDEGGRIRITGRKKEIIIRGGENICATEIDDYLEGCPGVGKHATIGMPDNRLGERICTFVVPADGVVPTLAGITAYLHERHVARRLWPEHIELIDAIPTTATGKVKRFLLTDELKKRMGEAAAGA